MLTSNLVVYTKINLNVDIKTSVVLADSLLNDIYLTLPTKQLNDQGRYDYIEVDIKKLSALNNVFIFPQNNWETIEGSPSVTLTSDNECIRIAYTEKGYKILSTNSSGGGSAFLTYQQIAVGDVTNAISSSSALVFDGSVIQVTTNGSPSGWGQVQNVVSSSSSEAGLSLQNTGAGGRNYNIISTSNASGIGGGNFSIGDASSSQEIFRYQNSDNSYTFPFLGGSGSVIVFSDNNGKLFTGSIPANYITSVSDTNTVDLDVTASNLTANVRYQDTSEIDLSDDASGLKADLKTTTVVAGS